MHGQAGDDDVARARALMTLSRWDEASTALGRLLVASPRSGSLWCLLAECRLGQRNWAAAAAAARSAIRLDPADVRAHLLASCAAGRRSRPAEALELARAAAVIAPSSWQAQAHLARLAAARGGADEACRAASRAVAVAPDRPAARVAMGLVAHSQARARIPAVADGPPRMMDAAAVWLHDAGARYNLDRRGIVSFPSAAAEAIAPAPRGSDRQVVRGAADDLPVVVRRLLARASYLLALTAVIAGWAPASPGPPVLAPALGLAAVGWYAAATVHRLERPLRRRLAAALVGRWVSPAAGLEIAAVGLLAALAVGRDLDDHHRVAMVVAAAVLAGLLMHLETRRTVERALAGPAPYLLGSGVLWVLASALTVLAAVRFVPVGDQDWSSSILVGAGCGAAALGTVATIVHRSRMAHPAVTGEPTA